MDEYDIDQSGDDDLPDYDLYAFSASEVWSSCAWPSITQIAKYSLPFIFWNVSFRIISQLLEPPLNYQHISSIICGLALSYFTLGEHFLYSFSFTLIEYALLLILRFAKIKNYGLILTIVSLSALLIGEVIDTGIPTWNRMRGTQMIAALKVISIGFDMDRKKIHNFPNPVEFWGYIFCPGNVIMGPWCAYNDYLNIFTQPAFCLYPIKSFLWIAQAVVNAFISLLFLVASTCYVESFVPTFGLTWGEAYKGALSFRCSHYFICFLSHCTMLISGLGTARSPKDNVMMGYTITKPWVIELPRSLVDVVVYWNLSMHYWLKTYIFQQVKPHGIFKAIIITYLVSSVLHGLNIQLSAVLLTLGFATYAEYTIRRKIADIYDACVLANACTGCSHRYNNRYPAVIAFNFAFRILAMIHLAYLGILLDGYIDRPDIEQSLSNIQQRWGDLDYMSHYMIAFTLGLSIVI